MFNYYADVNAVVPNDDVSAMHTLYFLFSVLHFIQKST